jgi:hypothetical protein
MNTQTADEFTDFTPADNGPVFIKSRRSFSVEGITQSVRNFATLSEALRMLGAAVLVASMSVFLLQGWSEGNDIYRYLLLLTQTGLLAAAGFAMSHGLRETRGARIFFGLALVSIPANFVILSALVYSVLQWDAGLINYPDYALWQIDTLAGTGLTLGGAMLVLVPITLLCYAIMARRSARSLSLHFILLNTLLLLPIRGSLAAGTIALVGAVYALKVVAKLTRNDRSLKTGEGKFALASLFIPIGIILFRSMYFYQIDSLMVAMVSMALFLSARQVSLFPDRSPKVALALEGLSVPVAFAVAWSLTDALVPIISHALSGPVFATVYTLLTMDILRRTESTKLTKIIGVTISLVVALSFTLGLAGNPGALTAILCLSAGTTLVFAGLSVRNHTAVFCGIFTLIGGVIFGADAILNLVVTSSWVELAIFGACAITLGSVIDRHGVAIKLRIVKWFDAIDEQREQAVFDEQ